MRRAAILAALALMPAGAAAADESAQVAGQSFNWRLASGGECRELWAFGADDVLTITSGEEVTTHSYELSDGHPAGMYRLDRTRISSNGQPDCQGHADASVGQRREVYLMFLNGGGFFTCASADTMSCNGVASPSVRPQDR